MAKRLFLANRQEQQPGGLDHPARPAGDPALPAQHPQRRGEHPHPEHRNDQLARRTLHPAAEAAISISPKLRPLPRLHPHDVHRLTVLR